MNVELYVNTDWKSASNCFPFTIPGVHKLEKHSVALGMVTKIQPTVGLLVKLPFGGKGAVAVTDLADAYRQNPLDGFSKDQLLRSVEAAEEEPVEYLFQKMFNMHRKYMKH